MIIDEELKNRIIATLIECSNNKDCQAYISPTNFGFSSKSDDTKSFRDFLLSLSIVKSAKIDGKDLISVIIEK